MLDTDRILAYAFPPHHCTIEKVKILEYADAIGDPNPVYRDEGYAFAIGYTAIPAPPGFAATFHSEPVRALLANRPAVVELGIVPQMILHGEQRFTYTTPLNAGDRLTISARFVAVEPGDRFDRIQYEATAVHQGGGVACVSRMTLIHRKGGESA